MPKNPAAVKLGKRGGKARARKLSKERRSEIARTAARARWSKKILKERELCGSHSFGNSSFYSGG